MSVYSDSSMRFMREYQKEDVIFEQGSEGDELFVIISGSVDISQKQDDGFRYLTTLEEGEIFGEMALVDRIPRTARAVAVRDSTRLIVVNQPRFIYLVSQQPVFALTIMQVLCDRIHNIEKKYKLLITEMSKRDR